MDFNTYQQEAAKTAIYPPALALHYLIPGLVVELDELKNTLEDIPTRDNLYVKKELGDVIWFCAMICKTAGYAFSTNDILWHDLTPNEIVRQINTFAMLALGEWVKCVRDNDGKIGLEEEKYLKSVTFIPALVDRFCSQYGYTLDEVMRLNLEKLADRQARGVLNGSGDER